MGSAISLLFAQEGANVILVARQPDIIQLLADKIREMGCEAVSIVADMTIAEDIKNVTQQVTDAFGTLDGFISLPGGGFRHVNDMVDIDVPFFEMMFNNHIATIFNSFRAIFPLMRDHGG